MEELHDGFYVLKWVFEGNGNAVQRKLWKLTRYRELYDFLSRNFFVIRFDRWKISEIVNESNLENHLSRNVLFLKSKKICYFSN